MAIRRIYCQHCEKFARQPITLEDRMMGWHFRLVTIYAQKPADHSITISEYDKGKLVSRKTEQLENLKCDQCGQTIPDEATAIAFTAWRGQEPGHWETAYTAPAGTTPPGVEPD
jgi:hypothetical protein